MMRGLRWWAAGLGAACLASTAAHAYTAAGDRQFPASLLLPQIAPSDEAYSTGSTLPTAGGRQSNLGLIYSKTLTERFGVEIEDGYNWVDQNGGPTRYGFQNVEVTLRYLAVIDREHEFLLTVGVDNEIGGTGDRRIAGSTGATIPQVYFGKGMGDFDIGYLRPLALTGVVGYAASHGGTRPDVLQAGLGVQYSLPYLQSKVESLDLPDLLRNVSLTIEYLYQTPTTPSHGQSTTGIVAPGFNYAGGGGAWELGVEALVPTTHAAGNGVGLIAHLHVAFDFLYPETFGTPLFGD